MAELPTDGMSYDGTGFVGSVGIVAFPKQDIETGDYQSNSSTLNELKEIVQSMMNMSPTDLLSSSNLANKIKLLDIEATIDSAKLIEQSNILLAKVITNSGLSNSLVIQENGSNDVLMQGVMLSAIQDQTKAIEAQTTAIKAQKLELNGDINVDTASIVDMLNDGVLAQKEISKHLENTYTDQKTLNEALLKKANEENAKDINYNGETYTKTQIEKLQQVESLKGLKDENDFELNDALELVEDFLIDGFDELSNPFKFFFDEVEKNLKAEYNEINIKYNLNMKEV